MKFKLWKLFIASFLCITTLVGCSSNNTDSGKASVKFILVLEDKSEVNYDVKVTDGATIREALFEAKLIDENEQSAMFVSNIDGHIADAMNDGVTWMPCDKDGKQINGTFDEITVSDGETIKLVYTVVPNFDD